MGQGGRFRRAHSVAWVSKLSGWYLIQQLAADLLRAFFPSQPTSRQVWPRFCSPCHAGDPKTG